MTGESSLYLIKVQMDYQVELCRFLWANDLLSEPAVKCLGLQFLLNSVFSAAVHTLLMVQFIQLAMEGLETFRPRYL